MQKVCGPMTKKYSTVTKMSRRDDARYEEDGGAPPTSSSPPSSHQGDAATPLFLLLFTVFVLTLLVSLSPYDLYLQRGLFSFNATHFIITPIKQTNRPKRGSTKTKAAMCCWVKVRLHPPFEAESLQIFNVWWEKTRYGQIKL